MNNEIKIKRIYELPDTKDGYRILVDRLWPRGVKKANAVLNEWNKEIAPSPELRIWFAHKPEHFEQFTKLYSAELDNKKDELLRLKHISKTQNLTLLYAAKSETINHARILLNKIKHITLIKKN